MSEAAFPIGSIIELQGAWHMVDEQTNNYLNSALIPDENSVFDLARNVAKLRFPPVASFSPGEDAWREAVDAMRASTVLCGPPDTDEEIFEDGCACVDCGSNLWLWITFYSNAAPEAHVGPEEGTLLEVTKPDDLRLAANRLEAILPWLAQLNERAHLA